MTVNLETELTLVDEASRTFRPTNLSQIRAFERRLLEQGSELPKSQRDHALVCLEGWKKRKFTGYWMTLFLVLFIFFCIEFGHYNSSQWAGVAKGLLHFWVFPLLALAYYIVNLRPTWLILKNDETKQPHLISFVAESTPEYERIYKDGFGQTVRRERVTEHHLAIAIIYVILTILALPFVIIYKGLRNYVLYI